MKVAFFCVVGVHVVAILVALLAQGCKREATPGTEAGQPLVPATDTNVPALDTNQPPPGLVASNPPTQLPSPELAPMPTATAQEYVIQKGDTFSTIAPKFHVTVKAIQLANPTANPSKLQIGQKITIPAPPAPTATPPAGTTSTPLADSGDQIYVVKARDTLTKIAVDHHTTVSVLRKLNKLTTDNIKIGDKLKLPATTSTAPAAPAPVPTTTAPAQ